MNGLSCGLKAHDLVWALVKFRQRLAFILLEFVLKGVSDHTPEIALLLRSLGGYVSSSVLH